MKKFVIILDALKANKLEIVYKILGKEISFLEVIPPFSFEPDASFLCGKHPQETNSGLKYWKKEKNSDDILFLFLKMLPKLPRLIRKIVNIALMKFNFHILKNFKGNYAYIPFRYLKYFELSQNRELFKKNSGFIFPTIFDLLNKTFFYAGVPFNSGRLEIIKPLINRKVLNEHDIFFFFISDLDHIGHKYGGNSIEYDNKLIEILQYIKSIFKKISDKNEEIQYLIFGDHGMVDADHYINIDKIIKKLSVKPEKDYLYFLDSTVARFWFFNQFAKEEIMNAISKLSGGNCISKVDRDKYHINYDHNNFGDEIWWADARYIISPNFWQGTKKLKGMHGYRQEVTENHTCVISNFAIPFYGMEPIQMIELNNILKNFLQIY